MTQYIKPQKHQIKINRSDINRHCYEKTIVEIKSEYTEFLLNIMTPLVYEGLKSMYDNALVVEERYRRADVKNIGVFKLFQTILKGIPTLNNIQIEDEAKRIKEHSRCSEWFDDLVKAVVKSHIQLLTFNNGSYKSKIIEEKHHEKVNVNMFVHKCYIECSRIFFDYPQLFWHKISTVEIKHNQREIYELIGKAIKEAIRHQLPIRLILNEYLSNDYIDHLSDDKYISVHDMVSRDLHGSKKVFNGGDNNRYDDDKNDNDDGDDDNEDDDDDDDDDDDNYDDDIDSNDNYNDKSKNNRTHRKSSQNSYYGVNDGILEEDDNEIDSDVDDIEQLVNESDKISDKENKMTNEIISKVIKTGNNNETRDIKYGNDNNNNNIDDKDDKDSAHIDNLVLENTEQPTKKDMNVSKIDTEPKIMYVPIANTVSKNTNADYLRNEIEKFKERQKLNINIINKIDPKPPTQQVPRPTQESKLEPVQGMIESITQH